MFISYLRPSHHSVHSSQPYNNRFRENKEKETTTNEFIIIIMATPQFSRFFFFPHTHTQTSASVSPPQSQVVFPFFFFSFVTHRLSSSSSSWRVLLIKETCSFGYIVESDGQVKSITSAGQRYWVTIYILLYYY